MKNRIIYGLIMAVLMVTVFFVSQYVIDIVYDIFVLFLMVVASHEMAQAIGHKYAKPMYPIVLVFIGLGYSAFKIVHTINGSGGITTFFVILIIMFVVCFIVNMASPRQTFENVISTFVCMIYPVGIMVYFLGLNYFPGGTGMPWFAIPGTVSGPIELELAFNGWVYNPMATGVFLPNYRTISIVMTFICASGADIMALVVGMIFKGPKLAPAISPKKTISGAIGGLFGGVLAAAMVFGFSFTGVFGLSGLHEAIPNSLTLYLLLGLLIAAATEVGDLMASYIKRFCGVKDYGKLIPGHGGILDRIDGAMLAAMVTYLFITVAMYFAGGAA